MLNIGILGLGTVGQGVLELISKRENEIEKVLNKKIKVKKILVRNLDKDRGLELEPNLLTDKIEDIIEDKDIEILVEVTSSLEEAYLYIREGLKNGKHIVTANKAVISKYFEELSNLAHEKGLGLHYEASVGGGIPILKPLKDQVILNEIDKLQGIVNGTCNYILTRMFEENLAYEEVLKDAQALGYAEEDPSADVEGYDSLRKLRILASLGLKTKVLEEDIVLEGIDKINSLDMENIKELNSLVKLIGESSLEEAGFTALVMPTIVDKESYFASVNQAYNSVALRGDNVGDLKFYGPGAGKLPTANAIMTDLLDIGLGNYSKRNILEDRGLENANNLLKGRFYLRISKLDGKGQEALERIQERLLTKDQSMAIITREIRLSEIYQLLEDLNIGRKDYFLARFI